MISVKQFTNILLLLIILLVASSARFTMLSNESLWIDESYTAYNINQINQDKVFDFHPPMYPFIIDFWSAIFGTSEIALRSLSALFGVISVLIFYFLADRLFGKPGSFLATLLYAVFPVVIYHDRQARPYSLLILGTLLCYYFYYSYISEKNIWQLLGLLLSCLLVIYTHYTGWLLIVAVNIHYVLYNRTSIRWFVLHALLALLTIPLIKTFLLHLEFYQLIHSQPVHLFTILSSVNHYFGNLALIVIYIIIFFILCHRIISIDSQKKKFMMFLLWFTVPLSLFVIAVIVTGTWWRSRFIAVISPSVIFIMWHLLSVFKRRERYLRITIFTFTLIFMIVGTVSLISAKHFVDWRSMVKEVKSIDSGDILITGLYAQSALPFYYYYNRSCFYSEDLKSCFQSQGLFHEEWLDYNFQNFNVIVSPKHLESLWIEKEKISEYKKFDYDDFIIYFKS